MSVIVTRHCDKRFYQRVARTKRMQLFIARALHFGKKAEDVRNGMLRKELLRKEKEYGTVARVYQNNIFWFDGETAITVMPLAQKYQGKA